MTDRRAAAPVVGKALEAAVLVLFVALLATTLFGGVLPDYRTAAGAEVADRTLAGAAERVERAVPRTEPVWIEREVRVGLPETIRGDRYGIRATGRALVIDHPSAGIGGRARLALPARVRVTGEWSSTDDAVVRVSGGREGLVVRLAERTPASATEDGGTT